MDVTSFWVGVAGERSAAGRRLMVPDSEKLSNSESDEFELRRHVPRANTCCSAVDTCLPLRSLCSCVGEASLVSEPFVLILELRRSVSLGESLAELSCDPGEWFEASLALASVLTCRGLRGERWYCADVKCG